MSRRAFTLMEMLVALAIIALIMGGSSIALSTLNDEKVLRQPLNDVRSLAKKAWLRSMQEQRAWQIRIMNDKFVLEPRRPAQLADQEMFQAADQQMGRGSGIETVNVPPEISIEVRHWGEENWRPAVASSPDARSLRNRNATPDIWVFEQSGLCEPINLRFSSDIATITVQFDPLTAAVDGETYEVKPP